MSISQEVQEAGREVAAASGAVVADMLNSRIGRFLGWPYKMTSGSVADRDGNKTEAFASIVYAARDGSAVPDPGAIAADTVAAVIDVSESLELESFRAAYARIAQAKRLKKSPGPRLEGTPSTTITLGIILAQHSFLALENFAEELERLNAQTPSREWPDMIVVASTGAMHYAAQFPGESLSGDYLPPEEGALAKYTPAMYVVLVVRPTGDVYLQQDGGIPRRASRHLFSRSEAAKFHPYS
jgi:hypothetical protein